MAKTCQTQSLPVLTQQESGRFSGLRQASKSSCLNRIGYWSLLLLVFMLPFEVRQYLFLNDGQVVFTNLKAWLAVVIVLALATLSGPALAFVRGERTRNNFFYRNRLALSLFSLFLLAATLSSLLAQEASMRSVGLKWTAQFGLTGLLWAGTVQWLTGRTSREINRLGLALVAGAVISALVGFGEFLFGRDFANSLADFFKVSPTTAGPYLRLSGTFEYANVAAMYFEMALPFALAGLASGLTGSGRWRWLRRLSWAAAIAVLAQAILLTLSRGAWLGLAVGLVVGVVAARSPASRAQGWWKALGLSAGIIVGLALLNFAFVPQLALRLTSQSDQDWYKASYQSTLPATLEVCQQLEVAVTVENQGPLIWGVAGQPPYHLSYHWLAADGHIAVFDGIRTNLTRSLVPGSRQTLPAKVRAPAQPGQYRLVWDMVQEEVTWFSLKSAHYTSIPVQVTGANPAETCEPSAPLALVPLAAPRATPAYLPTILSQPDRTELWPAALRMLMARPLLGIGPNGFRLNYGHFTSPPLSDWDKDIFANNLLLETLADLGVGGGGLLIAFLGVLLWPMLVALKRGAVLKSGQVAVVSALGAFFGHGLVDYILGSNSINLLFWILVGLAAALFTPISIKE
jgi:hypothetical protein